MPAKQTAKKAATSTGAAAASTTKVTDAAVTEAGATDAGATEAGATEAAAAASGAEANGAGDEAERVPANRAERRAKGKGGAAAQPTSRGKVVGGKGPASTQRMWANRRSG